MIPTLKHVIGITVIHFILISNYGNPETKNRQGLISNEASTFRFGTIMNS